MCDLQSDCICEHFICSVRAIRIHQKFLDQLGDVNNENGFGGPAQKTRYWSFGLYMSLGRVLSSSTPLMLLFCNRPFLDVDLHLLDRSFFGKYTLVVNY